MRRIKKIIFYSLFRWINYEIIKTRWAINIYIKNKNFFSIVWLLFLKNNSQIMNTRIIKLSIIKMKEYFELNVFGKISETMRSLSIKSSYYNNEKFIHIYKKAFLFNINLSFLFLRYYSNKSNSNSFNEWLAGVIDGDGCFLLSNKGYASLEITIQLRDVECLNLIKEKYGGYVKTKANKNHLRYRLHNKKGMLDLISGINGLIRNPIRLLQLAKICEKYNIPVLDPKPLTYNNGWLSGFFDTDGSIYFNLLSSQMFITAAQKNKFLLEPLTKLYGGSVYLSKGKTHFKWIVYRKEEINNLIKYFNIYPPKSAKLSRINLIAEYNDLRSKGGHKAISNSVLGKLWKEFLIKWENYEYKE